MTNSFNNGLLPITLPDALVDGLFDRVAAGELWLTVDLREQTIRADDGDQWTFTISPALRERLLSGLDDIGLTLAHAEAIQDFERRRRAECPWVFGA